jgi:lauroyl/myristoyl acyltransferase
VSSVYWLARGGSACAKWTPRPVRHVLGSTIGAASYLAWHSKRLVTQQNMAQVTNHPMHDPRVRRLAYASWYNYGRYAADFIHFSHLDMKQVEHNIHDLSADGVSWQELLAQALQPGRGVVITTAHFGNWDVAGALIARYIPLSAVAETFSDPRLNTLLQSQRKEKGINVIPMEGSARRILRVLHQKEAVAIVADRPVAADEGVPITFFGRATYVPAGPAALALKSGASLLPGFVWYGPRNQWYLRAFSPIFPQDHATGDQKRDITTLTQRTYDALEEMVRKWPTQWYMFRPFWPA